MLLVAFVLGQGALFLAQTWLMITGQQRILGEFALTYVLVTFSTQLVDWGAQTVLARDLLNHGLVRTQRAFWAFVVWRSTVAVAALGIALFAASVGPISPFQASLLFASLLSLPIQAFNCAGILDGADRSGWSGVSTALPPLASAIALALTEGVPESSRGLVVGTAFTGGTLGGVLAQLLLLSSAGLTLGPPALSVRGLRGAVVDGLHAMLFTIPGQIFYRVQVIVAAAVSPMFAGSFVYAKQIVSFFAQVSWFARRAEFPLLAATAGRPVWRQLRAAKLSATLSFGGMLLAAACALIILTIGPEDLRLAAMLLLALSVSIFTSAVAAVLSQLAILGGMMGRGAVVVIGANFLGAALLYSFGRTFPVALLALVEAATHVMICGALLVALHKRHSSDG